MNNWKQEMLSEVSLYRDLRPHNLTAPRFRHIFLLLYWCVYGLLFYAVEHSDRDWTYIVWPAVDGAIPFCEWFVIPYMFWFVFLGGMVAFTLLFDVEAFRKMQYFIIITYTVTIIIYFIWPTAQDLRPDIAALGRDNFFTRFMQGFYEFDTNTNVCPSIHVLGSVAVLVTSWHCKYFRAWPWQIFFWVTTVAISLSTVFLKQHSIVDVILAIPVALLGYVFAFHGEHIFRKKQNT